MSQREMESDSNRSPNAPGDGGEEREAPWGWKLALTLFPFLMVLIFLLVEGWIRGRP